MVGEPITVLGEALRWMDRGASPIPVPYRMKKPAITEWQRLRIEKRDAHAVFNGSPMNIGVLWGEASGGLVDVDLDHPLAVRLAPELLPASTTYGRPGAPRSHLIFRSPGAVTMKWHASGIGMIVELRSSGAQSLVPPSRHDEVDESYVWYIQTQPVELPPEKLAKRLALIAAGTVLAPFWKQSVRHELTLALAGAMLTCGWGEQSVLDLVLALERISPDAPELKDREDAVISTVRRLDRGQSATGLPSLAAVIGEPAVALLKQERWLNLGAFKQGTSKQPEPQPFTEEEEVIVDCMANVTEVPIRWLWPNRFARRKLSMIAGKQGVSKSVLTCELAARVSNGTMWPIDKTPCESGGVLMISAEDDPGDTIRPRLRAAGANLDRIHFIKGVRSADGKERLITFADVAVLDRYLSLHVGEFSTLIADPIGAFMGQTDTYRDNEVRNLLVLLKGLAEKYTLAVILVAHLNKAQGMDALYRVLGSVAFTAAVRTVYIVAADPDNAAQLLLVGEKTNISPIGMAGLVYRLENVELGGGIRAPRVVWEGIDGRSAAQVLAKSSGPQEVDVSGWLMQQLAKGPVPVREVRKAAEDELPVSWSTVKRAAGHLHVVGKGEHKHRMWEASDKTIGPSAHQTECTDGSGVWPDGPENGHRTIPDDHGVTRSDEPMVRSSDDDESEEEL